MLRTLLCSSLLLITLVGICPARDTQTKALDDWATVTAPTEYAPNKPFDVKVKLHGKTAATKLCVDFNYMKKDGQFGGYLQWVGTRKDVAGNEELTFTYSITAMKPDLGSALLTVFLSEDGGWTKRTHTGSVGIPIKPGTDKVPTYKKSWLDLDYAPKGKLLKEGDEWTLTAEYYLDPDDDIGGTTLHTIGLGPWVDCPDGTYTTKRHHVPLHGSRGQKKIAPGRGTAVFTFKIPKGYEFNSILNVVYFADANGKKWPWEKRSGGPAFRKRSEFFLDTEQPGNLFTYDQPVRLTATLDRVKDQGQNKTLTYTVFDTTGATVTSGTVAFTVEEEEQQIPIDLKLERRGLMLLRAEVEGWETRETTFGRIPDVMKTTGGRKTRFGFTDAMGDEEACKVARLLGLTSCRKFFSWKDVQPARNEWRLEGMTQALETGKRHGIDTWLLIGSPPNWVLKNQARDQHFSAFAFDQDAWRESITVMDQAWKDLIIGWEWLNEIVPGDHTRDPVGDYLAFCRIGNEVIRKSDPDRISMLAGGLWPRSFRQSLLAAGIGGHINVLPLHYSNGGAILEARGDLDAVDAEHVRIWDNETARGISVWDMPRLEAIQHTKQSNWLMERWPDELIAGAERIIYFGGGGDAAGNWSYLMSDMSPRPPACTLAVMTAKLFESKGLGAFSLGQGGTFHLFEDRNGKAVLVASSYVADGETLPLHVGTDRLLLTDQQGNETTQAANGGVAELRLNFICGFVEGADIDVLKAYVVPSVGAEGSAANTEVRGASSAGTALLSTPKISMLSTRPGKIVATLRNLYDRELSGTCELSVPEGWPAVKPVRFAVQPGKTLVQPMAIEAPEGAEPGDHALVARFSFDWEKLPAIEKPFGLSVLSPDMLGNLIKNGDFETAGKAPNKADHWGGDAGERAAAPSDAPGHGKWVLRFGDTQDKYNHCSQGLPLKGGQTYLYTVWIANEDMGGGSNIDQVLHDGTQESLYVPHVFALLPGGAPWQVYTKRYSAPENVKSVGFTPVVKGAGYATYDNVRVTRYEGTDFAAEAYRVKNAPAIDGDLADWDGRCPIPLIGQNQLEQLDTTYAWSPANLSGVAYLRWDDGSLYLAAKVRDDRHAVPKTGEDTQQSDGLVIGMQPSSRLKENDGHAFAFYLSAAHPGGGSGRHTLYRPPSRSGGLSKGHLAKDSSVYEMEIKHADGMTIYEIRMPLSELGNIVPAIGTKLGLSLELNDNDGGGRAAAMRWGGGIAPRWMPTSFGVVTFLEQ